jgi:hypothetical protein
MTASNGTGSSSSLVANIFLQNSVCSTASNDDAFDESTILVFFLAFEPPSFEIFKGDQPVLIRINGDKCLIRVSVFDFQSKRPRGDATIGEEVAR